MTQPDDQKADALRFITGFELKHGRGPSTIEVADALFDGNMPLTEYLVRRLLAERQLHRNFSTPTSRLQALTPLAVPRSAFGEPLHFIRIEGPVA